MRKVLFGCWMLCLSMQLWGADEGAIVFDKQDFNCKKGAIPILILGAFHMDNPGQDTFNVKVQDVLTPQKQKEIAEVLDKLTAFHPTKIAVEASFKGGNFNAQKEYEQFLANQHELTRNEIEQIGFALAKRMNHKAIYPVDFSMWMDGRIPAEIGQPKPKPETPGEKKEEAVQEPPEIYKQMDKIIKEESVLSALRFMNTWEYTRADHALYVEMLKPDPYSDALYGNTDPVSNWYKRNQRIFTNIYRMAEPGDRILLLIGAGHNAIQRQLAIDSGDFCLANTGAYLQ